MSEDIKTAAAFASSWNNLPCGSVYTTEQFVDWLYPISKNDVEGKTVLEMGCGNGSLLCHMIEWKPKRLVGIDLGESVKSAEQNLSFLSSNINWEIIQKDIVGFQSDGFDLVYCIGVLHHLKNPKKGLDAIIRNLNPGGKFHCWVYAKEGNTFIRWFVEPIRRITCHLPWFFTKYFVATPLAVPFYFYSKTISKLPISKFKKLLPLYDYSLWISKREFKFFQHVAFDQLVTPHTLYIEKKTIQKWLADYDNEIFKDSIYLIMRNGNSWKFGGIVK